MYVGWHLLLPVQSALYFRKRNWGLSQCRKISGQTGQVFLRGSGGAGWSGTGRRLPKPPSQSSASSAGGWDRGNQKWLHWPGWGNVVWKLNKTNCGHSDTLQWTPSIPATLGTSQSALIRGVASFQEWICIIKHILGLLKWPVYRGSHLSGVWIKDGRYSFVDSCTSLLTIWLNNQTVTQYIHTPTVQRSVWKPGKSWLASKKAPST